MAHAKEGTTLLPLHDLDEKTYKKIVEASRKFLFIILIQKHFSQ